MVDVAAAVDLLLLLEIQEEAIEEKAAGILGAGTAAVLPVGARKRAAHIPGTRQRASHRRP
jgi:hypothetical protein